MDNVLGWQPGCNTRGTWDIIWTCTQTIALCAWVAVCPNIPAPDHGPWALYIDKFYFFLLTLLGPEFIFFLAFGQFQSAVTSRKLFHEMGYMDWSLTHGFYADMGGIHVQPSGWKRFPVNSRQLHYLIKRGYMEYPKIAKKDIFAAGKIDGLARLITVIQALNFLVTTVTRLVTGLAVTTFEMTVLANIFATLATFIVWWQKPTDVETCRLYSLQTTIETIVREAGADADGQYKDTPLDFVSREEWSGSLHWNYYVNILRRLHLFTMFHRDYEKPAKCVKTFNFPKPGSRTEQLFFLAFSLTYCAFFLGAWNFYFPSNTERTIWRTVVVAQCIFTTIVAIFETICFLDVAPQPREVQHLHTTDSVPAASASEKSRINAIRDHWNTPCNNELTGNFSFMDVPLRSLLLTTPCCAGYVICRWMIIALDVSTLRLLPASAFRRVDWSPYWPWF